MELFCKIYNLIQRCEKMLTWDLGNKWRFHIYLHWMGLPFSNAPITSHTYVGKHTSLLIFNKKKIKKIKKEALLTVDLFMQSFILFLWPHKFWFLQQKCCQNKLIYVFLFIHRKKLASIYLTSCQRSIFHSFHFWCSRTLFTQKAKLHKDDFCLKNYLGKFMHKSNHTVFKTYYTILSIW